MYTGKVTLHYIYNPVNLQNFNGISTQFLTLKFFFPEQQTSSKGEQSLLNSRQWLGYTLLSFQIHGTVVSLAALPSVQNYVIPVCIAISFFHTSIGTKDLYKFMYTFMPHLSFSSSLCI